LNMTKDSGSLIRQMRDVIRARKKKTVHHPHKTGMDLLNQGDFDKASDSFRQAIKENPQFPFSYHGLGVASFHLGKNREAKENFDKCLELNPQYADTYSFLARLQMRELNPAEAERLFRKALSLNPDLVDALVGLAKVLIDSSGNQNNKISDLLKRAYFLRPEDGETLSLLLDNCEAKTELYIELAEFFFKEGLTEKAAFFEHLVKRLENSKP